MTDFCGLAALFLETAVSPVNLLASSEKLVVGVSGGPDSLALLHVLARVVGPTRLVAAHLNHGYRKTAVAEADFVREISGSWGIAFEVSTVDLPLVAQQSGDSLEEAGRKARYAFLREVAAAHGTHYLAVGHHADDQAETVLMNLLRGSGLRGLRGMLPVTLLAEAPDYYVLRPFLTVNRADIEAYCQEHALTPVFDESNEDISFFRNRIRQELLPLLEDYNAGIRAHLRQLAAMAAADVALLDSLTADAWARTVKVDKGVIVLDRAAWLELPLGLRRSVLRQAVAEKRPFLPDITFQAIEQARLVAEKNTTGQRVHLPGDLRLIVDYDRLLVTEDESVQLDDWPQMEQKRAKELPVPGLVELANGWKIEAAFVEAVDLPQIQKLSDKWRVYAALPADQNLFVRVREPGERFQPLGMNGRSAKVKEVMINRKIGARWRANWPIVAGPTHLIWLTGHALDERMKISKESTSIVLLTCYKG